MSREQSESPAFKGVRTRKACAVAATTFQPTRQQTPTHPPGLDRRGLARLPHDDHEVVHPFRAVGDAHSAAQHEALVHQAL
jgi:hypothetical protein